MTERFVPLAEQMLGGLGLTRRAIIMLPKTELTEYGSEEEVREIADHALAAALAQLRQT